MPKKLEPVKCRCGRKAFVEHFAWAPPGTRRGGIFVVECGRGDKEGALCCWVGPDRSTERGAILAWNKVMEEPDG